MRKAFNKGSLAGNYTSVKLNTDALEQVHSALLAKYVTRVGILGGKTNRTKVVTSRNGMRRAGKSPDVLTNAEIGLIHEKGSASNKIPRRSFLEMPLVLKSAGLLAVRNKLWAVYQGGPDTKARLREAYVNLGLIAERIIQRAFETRGFGRWAQNKKATIRRKNGSDMPLIDTAQLRRSITSDVVTK